jgi:hypothetical protein
MSDDRRPQDIHAAMDGTCFVPYHEWLLDCSKTLYALTFYALCSLYAHIQKLGVTSRQEETSQFVREKPPAKKPRVAKIRAG